MPEEFHGQRSLVSYSPAHGVARVRHKLVNKQQTGREGHFSHAQISIQDHIHGLQEKKGGTNTAQSTDQNKFPETNPKETRDL